MPHAILNPEGATIEVPSWIVFKLRKFGLLYRDPAQRRERISPRWYVLSELLKTQDRGPSSARAINYGNSGRLTLQMLSPLYKALGPDCSGPGNPMECTCPACDTAIVYRGWDKRRAATTR